MHLSLNENRNKNITIPFITPKMKFSRKKTTSFFSSKCHLAIWPHAYMRRRRKSIYSLMFFFIIINFLLLIFKFISTKCDYINTCYTQSLCMSVKCVKEVRVVEWSHTGIKTKQTIVVWFGISWVFWVVWIRFRYFIYSFQKWK